MTSVEEALVDRINHLTVGLEGCLQEVNLLHQMLNIIASPPVVPIVTQGGWNVMPEIIILAGWKPPSGSSSRHIKRGSGSRCTSPTRHCGE
ncbi:hypothetical protein Hanom_Chr08g00723391 [Helianthus anomalus]